MTRLEYLKIIEKHNISSTEIEVLLQAFDIGREQGLEEAKQILNVYGKSTTR